MSYVPCDVLIGEHENFTGHNSEKKRHGEESITIVFHSESAKNVILIPSFIIKSYANVIEIGLFCYTTCTVKSLIRNKF